MKFLSRARARAQFLGDLVKRTAVQRRYLRTPPPIVYGAEEVLFVEGLWDNPNHWLRLWMLMHAVLRNTPADVVGVVRSRKNWDNWNKRRSLEALGVRRFVYLEDARPASDFFAEADRLLSGAKTARDFLALQLPEGLPAYTVFDTVLKLARHPQPVFEGNPVWRNALVEMLQLADLYKREFDAHKVIGVISSHAWKNEWAALCWSALRRRIPFYYLTAHYNSIRVRRMSCVADYLQPNEHLGIDAFNSMPTDIRRALVERGREYLAERFNGHSDFIIIRYAMRPEQRGQDRSELLSGMGLDPNKPMVVIYAHSWFDFPHTQGMTNFTEPLDWIRFTIETITPLTEVNWAFKSHPCDQWYGDIRLQDLITGLPSHIALVPDNSDSLAVQTAADAVITIQGTIAIEAAAMGKRALCADRGMYTPWDFAHTANTRAEYAQKLRDILHLALPSHEQSERAMAFAATALAPPPDAAGSLKLSCDTLFLEKRLYHSINLILDNEGSRVLAEVDKLSKWVAERHPSYNVWRTLNSLVESAT